MRISPEQWINAEDKGCREGRISRLKWVRSITPLVTFGVFPGGWMAKALFGEATYCFVYAQFVATVALGVAYIERTLAGMLYAAASKRPDEEGLANSSTPLLTEAGSRPTIARRLSRPVVLETRSCTSEHLLMRTPSSTGRSLPKKHRTISSNRTLATFLTSHTGFTDGMPSHKRLKRMAGRTATLT